MTHPDDLLAEYVDGALGPDERARVEAHVAGCDRCRHEVDLARRARAALAGLPEVPAPAGIGLQVRRQVRRPPRVGRWGWAAAAAVVVAAGIAVYASLRPAEQGAVGGGGGGAPVPQTARAPGQAPAGGAAEAADARSALLANTTYTVTRRNYDTVALARLGRRLRDRARVALTAGFPQSSKGYFDDFDPTAFPRRARTAIECVLRDVPPEEPAAPFTVEAARFQGQPAYVATFLQGPTPEARYDRVLIWVVSRDSCQLLYFASQRL